MFAFGWLWDCEALDPKCVLQGWRTEACFEFAVERLFAAALFLREGRPHFACIQFCLFLFGGLSFSILNPIFFHCRQPRPRSTILLFPIHLVLTRSRVQTQLRPTISLTSCSVRPLQTTSFGGAWGETLGLSLDEEGRWRFFKETG